MAENITDNILASGLSQLSNSAKETNSSLEGIHEIEINLDKITKDYYDKAEKSFKKIIDLLTIIASGDSDASAKGPLEKLNGIVGDSKNKNDKNKPKKINKNITLEQLITYNDSAAASAIFLHKDLEKIINLLQPSEESKEKKSSNLGSLFKGLGNLGGGLIAVAAALAAFAGATLIFNKVDFGQALKGLGLFAAFVLGTVAIAKSLQKEKKVLDTFAKNILIMVGAYAAFGIVLLIVSNITKYIDKAGLAATLSLFVGFVVGTVALAYILKESEHSLEEFAKGVLLMVSGYLLFGATLVIVSNIAKYVKPVELLATLALFAGFVVGTVFLAKFVNKNKTDFVEFAASSLLMAAAYLAFGLSISAIGAITKHLGPGGWTGILLTLASFAIVVALTNAASKTMDLQAITKLAIGSTLMSVSFLAFGLAVKALSTISLKELISSIGIIATMALLVVGLGVLGNAITALMPGLIVFSVAAVLLSTSLVLFAGGISLAVLLINKISITKQTFANIGLISLFMLSLAPIGLAAAAAIVPMAFVAAWAALAVPSLLGIFAVLKELDTLNITEAKHKEYKEKISNINDTIHLISKALQIDGKDVIKMTLFVAAAAPIIAATLAASLIISTIHTLSKLNLDKDQIDVVLSSLDSVIVALGNYAEQTKGISIKAAKAMNIALGGITESIKNISDTIIRLKSITPEEVDAANSNLKMIIEKLFISKKKGDITIASVFESIPHVGKKALNGANALKSITSSIEDLTNIIISLKDVKAQDVNSAIWTINQEIPLFKTIGDLLNFLGDLKPKKLQQAKENIVIIDECLSALQQALPEDGIVIDLSPLNEINKFDYKTFGFVTKKIREGAQDLKDGAKYIKNVNNSLSKMDPRPLEKITVSFDKLISQTSQLKELVNTINDLAKSMDNLPNVPKKGLADNLSNIGSSLWAKATNAFSSKNKDSKKESLSFYDNTDRAALLNILADLDTIVKNGVKVQSSIDTHNDDIKKAPYMKEEKYTNL